jgi:hypothetical protein
MSAPSLAEVREGGQPPGLKNRRNEEHWAGRLYMRDVSPYFTWLFVRIGFSPNQLTYLMIVCGVLGGAAVAVAAGGTTGLVWAIVGALLIQAYLLLDCSDGEVARFRKRTSVTGVYLDRIGHYMSEVALLAGLGVRAQGAWENGGYVELGLLAALGAALIKAETDNVVVARAKAGLPAGHDDEALTPASAGLARARRAASVLKVHRITHAVELSLLILIAAIADAITGDLTATHVLLIACLIVAGLMVIAHLVAIMASRRLR